MRIAIYCVLTFLSIGALGQNIPQVPSNIEVAGMKLKITDDARQEIQKDVNALRASDKYFRIKLDRVNLYFPIIERVFKEEGVPDELKYLSVQESALISDAVSSSDAVGYWQFKDFTAREVGLRVDNKVDERKNIVAASRGAAKYFKRNNMFFNNWMYAVNAYMTGPGGAQRYVDKANFGKDRMEINKKTHWYVKRFLAHYIAFKDEIGQPHSQGMKLVEYTQGANKDLGAISKQFNVDENLVRDYNKWLNQHKVPDDKTYAVIVPVIGKVPRFAKEPEVATSNERKEEPVHYPRVLSGEIINHKKLVVTINGLDAVIADRNDKLKSLALETNVSIRKLEKFNDLRPGQALDRGQAYYVENKKNRSKIFYHVATHNESLWDISQKYGVKLKKLAKKNRMEISDPVKPGRLMWLRKNRSKNEPIKYYPIPPRKSQAPSSIIVSKEILSKDPKVAKEPKIDKGGATPPPSDQSLTKVNLFKYHPVSSGETLVAISTFYGIPASQIREWNEMSAIEEVKTGQNIRLKTDKEIQKLPVIKRIEEPPTTIVEIPKENNSTTHTVQAGEGLWAISRKYGVTVEGIRDWNDLNGSDISVGQELVIKTGINIPETTDNQTAPDTNQNASEHIVQSGESLWSIARRYEITVEQLKDWNQITDGSSLAIGQKIIIRTTSEPLNKYATFIVKPGDSLFKIAKQFDMTIEEIMKINGLDSSSISVGDELKVIKK